MQERPCGSVQAFPILGQSPASVQPGDGPFNDPSPGQDKEALRLVRSLDDLDGDASRYPSEPFAELRPLITTIGVELGQERIKSKQSGHDQYTTLAILNISRMNDRVE